MLTIVHIYHDFLKCGIVDLLPIVRLKNDSRWKVLKPENFKVH